ncbi:MAG TPA: AraC family transcriptional regulator [Chryseosolibacter sp.]|nr:AraC family transcriptional regulator [Chryseosolibacter sp.]
MDGHDSLIEKLIFSSAEHGRISFFQTTESRPAQGFISVRAAGRFGTLRFREVQEEAYSFAFSDFEIEEEITLNVMLDAPYLGVFVNLRGNLSYSQEGLRPGSMGSNTCSVISLPHLHMKSRLQPGTYSRFGISFDPAYLAHWEGAFPTLQKLHEKTEKNIHVYDHIELRDPESARRMIADIEGRVTPTEQNRLHRKNRINDLLLTVFEQYEGSITRARLYPAEIEKLNEIHAFLMEHPEEVGLTLKKLSQDAGMNVFKLKYGFKKLFGLPVFEFFFEERMKHAKELLADRKVPIHEIALRVGYKNVASFSAAFRKRFGFSPKDVR